MKKYTLIFTAVSFIFLGSGCSSSDADLVIDFINDWAQSRGIVDKDGDPTPRAIAYGLTGMSTGDRQADAAIDAGSVITSVKDADEKADKAQAALDKTPPDRDTALENLTEAVDSRPKDWHLRSQKGVLLLEMGSTTGAKEYLVSSSSSCDPGAKLNQVQQERCFKQLQEEANRMAGANARADRAGEKSRCDLLRAQSEANARLASFASDLNYSQDNVEGYRSASDSLRTNTDCR